MATQVLIAHTGQRLEVDVSQFSSLEDLKAWVGQHSPVSPQHFIALTPQGRSIKYATLTNETEIFVYDNRTTQSSSKENAQSIASQHPLPRRYTAPSAPNSIDDVKSIGSWQTLYKDRRAWAVGLLEECTKMRNLAQDQYGEIDVMIKCLDAAVANLELSVKQLEPKYKELKKWVEPAVADHDRLVSSLQENLALARNTHVNASIVKFMTRGQVNKGSPTLEDLIETETAKKAAKLAPTAHRRFSDKATSLEQAAIQMYQGLEQLIGDFEKLVGRSVVGNSQVSIDLLEDIESTVKQIDSDYRTALSLGNSHRDLTQVSKTASNHTERLVPNLKKRVKEMDDHLRYVAQNRNIIAIESVELMQAITKITSLRTSVKDHINILNQSEDDMTTFDYLRLIHQLPYMYASFMVEAIRRREWNDKIKSDSSTLANEMALFQDEESKRRRKWQKMVGSTYGPSFEANVIGLEVSILGEDHSWPSAQKEELDEFLDSLRSQTVDEALLSDIDQLLQQLNSPTRQQTKRLKAFKNGSMHEAALGRSGLMIRGDDDLLRSLQDDKSKLENKLKTAESRVRRLEDLLHRQTHVSRPGNLFQAQVAPSHERTGSTSSIKSSRPEDRRSSDGSEALMRKITQLENELREEKERSSRIQQDLSNRATQHDDMKDQIQEVNLTKKDLLQNMEALEREFVEERKSLEGEIRALKTRLEDAEDEIEHFGDSRMKDKALYDDRIQELETEIDRIGRERNDESLKAQGQIDFLRTEARMQREQRDALETQLQSAQEDARDAHKKVQASEEVAKNYLETLQKVFSVMAPDVSIPDEAADLTDSVQTFVTDVLAKLQNLESDTELLKSDLDRALNTVKIVKADLAETKDRLSTEEAASIHLRENSSEEKAKVDVLERELTEAKEELSSLRARLSDGETGSETLRKKLDEEEKKVVNLTKDIASRQSQVGGLEEELHLYKEKLDSEHEKLAKLSSLYESRDERSKDLTQRLYSQNDRICHLLERIGYSVTRQDGEIAINKIPRAERTPPNANDSSDPSNSIRKSTTLGARALHDSGDLDLLYWTNNDDASKEADNYRAFINKLGDFNVDLFSETVYHRIREVEHKAKKWQRDARSYRERAHQLQRDSHEKIAFKHFKEGDLALFLPTRNQQAGAWAAFNVGFPHYFLREQDAHRLRQREWLVARITRIEQRVVDLSKSLQPGNETGTANGEENDNPFQLSDGLRWYLIDAQEDKPGAPATPGMGKSTVASNNVEAVANIHTRAAGAKGKNRDSVASIEGINKTLSKSLESRRSSSSSKRAHPLLKTNAVASETNSLRAGAVETPVATSPLQGGVLSASDFDRSKATASASLSRSPERGRAVRGNPGPAQRDGLPEQEAAPSTPEVRKLDALLGP
ncbi:unnamed protein product [Clonostachys chloroleuca]|uniref:Autophagy-related protein 11 n=1 Tax=Clonostachys chloroleuca TaxID=1926264 RepID=A0AA35MFK6_9HYPO|nr:unnamed protein product [Clonostachys chloroleuca]